MSDSKRNPDWDAGAADAGAWTEHGQATAQDADATFKGNDDAQNDADDAMSEDDDIDRLRKVDTLGEIVNRGLGDHVQVDQAPAGKENVAPRAATKHGGWEMAVALRGGFDSVNASVATTGGNNNDGATATSATGDSGGVSTTEIKIMTDHDPDEGFGSRNDTSSVLGLTNTGWSPAADATPGADAGVTVGWSTNDLAVADLNAGVCDDANPAKDGEVTTGLDAQDSNNTIVTAVDTDAGWGADASPAVAGDGDWGITGDSGGWDTGPAPGVDETNITPSSGNVADVQSSTTVPDHLGPLDSLTFSPPAVPEHSAYISQALDSFSSYEPPTGGRSPGGAGTGIGQFAHISRNETYEEPLRSLNPHIVKDVGGGDGPASVYRCHDCEKAVEFRFREWMRCPECGCGVFRKDRRRVIAQFEAR